MAAVYAVTTPHAVRLVGALAVTMPPTIEPEASTLALIHSLVPTVIGLPLKAAPAAIVYV